MAAPVNGDATGKLQLSLPSDHALAAAFLGKQHKEKKIAEESGSASTTNQIITLNKHMESQISSMISKQIEQESNRLRRNDQIEKASDVGLSDLWESLRVEILSQRKDDLALLQALKDFIEEQAQRLEASFDVKIQGALEQAGTIFLQCLERQQQSQQLPVSGQEQAAEIVSDVLPIAQPSRNPTFATALPEDQQLKDSAPAYFHGDSSRSAGEGKFQPDSKDNFADLMQIATWEMAELNKGDSEHSWHHIAYMRKLEEKSITLTLFSSIGLGDCFPHVAPKRFFFHLTHSQWFQTLVGLAIVLSTVLNAYWSDQSCRRRLMEPPEGPETWPKWWDRADSVLTIFFTVELALRLVAERGWFWVSGSWRWNLLDFALVVISLSLFLLDVDGLGDILFLRLMRAFRVVRVARVFRVVRAFTELRKLLFAVVACIVPLAWAMMFIGVTMLLFSLLMMQGLSLELPAIYDNDQLMLIARDQLNGIFACCKTLFVVIFGPDWLEPHAVLSELGFAYGMVMPTFVIFVNLGLMNIVIGVFAEAASRCSDRDLIAQSEIGDVEGFIHEMLCLWKEFAPDGERKVNWDDFKEHFYKEDVQAFLASHSIDTSHVHLIFALCNKNKDDYIQIREFVLGLLRLKGQAKLLDSKIMVHALSALSQDVEIIRSDLARFMSGFAEKATATPIASSSI